VQQIHPIRLEASLHETIWGGRRLEEAGWKRLPNGTVAIGEAWETELNTVAQNAPYRGKTLEQLVQELGVDLLGHDTVAVFGQHFPLLAKFIDANAQLSVQVHPNDQYAAKHEQGKLGKTEFWYILAATPGARIVHGFQATTTRAEVLAAIEQIKLEDLVHEEPVAPGDVILVPAGTVHAIGGGVLLYELQEYSDVTYRMYDYGRLDAHGKPRELHIERSLDVAHYGPSRHIQVQPVTLADTRDYLDRCLVACRYFVTREVVLRQKMEGETSGSCLIISALGSHLKLRYGERLQAQADLDRGQTMILPATLGHFCIEGKATFLYSYVPSSCDISWQKWREQNS
jgi:mannose-6-phosphate isomerase